MTQSHVITIKDAVDILERTKHADYLKYTIELLDTLKFDRNAPFKEYLDMIETETEQWIMKFPLSLKSITSLVKPKTALLNLLRCKDVVDALGADYCLRVGNKIASTWRTISKQEVERRSATRTGTVVVEKQGCSTKVDDDRMVNPDDEEEELDDEDEDEDGSESEGSAATDTNVIENEGESTERRNLGEQLAEVKAAVARLQAVNKGLNNSIKRQQETIRTLDVENKNEAAKVVLLKSALTEIVDNATEIPQWFINSFKRMLDNM